MKKVKKMYKINEKFLQYTDIPCPPTVIHGKKKEIIMKKVKKMYKLFK